MWGSRSIKPFSPPCCWPKTKWHNPCCRVCLAFAEQPRWSSTAQSPAPRHGCSSQGSPMAEIQAGTTREKISSWLCCGVHLWCMKTEREKNSLRCISPGCGLGRHALDLLPLERVLWNPADYYMAAIKHAGAKAWQTRKKMHRKDWGRGTAWKWCLFFHLRLPQRSAVPITQEDARWFCTSLGLPCTPQEYEEFLHINQIASIQRRSTVLQLHKQYTMLEQPENIFSQLCSINHKYKIVDTGNRCCCHLQSYSNWLWSLWNDF